MESLRHIETIKTILKEMYTSILNKCNEEGKMLVTKNRYHRLVNDEDTDKDDWSELYVVGVQASENGKGLQLVISPTTHNITTDKNRIWWRTFDFDITWENNNFRRYISDFVIL